jgi:hypothetical protein
MIERIKFEYSSTLMTIGISCAIGNRKLHLKALTDLWVVPIASQEYITLVRSPWEYKGPKLFASGALWHLRHP